MMGKTAEYFHENFIQGSEPVCVAIYGMGIDTADILDSFPDSPVRFVLDGVASDGMFHGKPIIPIEKLPPEIRTVVIVARKASEAIIFRRIRDFCNSRDIRVTNVRNEDIAAEYGQKRACSAIDLDGLKAVIDAHEYISFDIFGTLLFRRFGDREIIYRHIARTFEPGFDFSAERMAAERRLSESGTPTIGEIYKEIERRTDADDHLLKQLLEEELRLEGESLSASPALKEAFFYAVGHGKKVCLVSDMYFSRKDIEGFLKKAGIEGYADVFVSCEYGCDKRRGLFEIYKEKTGARNALHIGDDPEADCEAAAVAGIDPFPVDPEHSFSDHWDFGYRFLGPALTAFAYWILRQAIEDGIERIFFISRDGFILKRIYDNINTDRSAPPSDYLLTSRTAAVLSYIRTRSDIEFAAGLPFSGTRSELLKKRFHLTDEEIGIYESAFESEDWLDAFEPAIFCHAAEMRTNFLKYLSGFGLEGERKAAIVDFVSSGTNQLCLERLLGSGLYGLYFERMFDGRAEKDSLSIKSFYTPSSGCDEIEYFRIEPLIKEPVPSLFGFDSDGKPVFCPDGMTSEEKSIISEVQSGIEQYASDYISMLGDAPDKDFTADALERLRCAAAVSLPVTNRDIFTNREA